MEKAQPSSRRRFNKSRVSSRGKHAASASGQAISVSEKAKGRKEMAFFMKGEPLVAKLAAIAKFGVFPAAMAAALFYSPPDYVFSKKDNSSK